MYKIHYFTDAWYASDFAYASIEDAEKAIPWFISFPMVSRALIRPASEPVDQSRPVNR